MSKEIDVQIVTDEACVPDAACLSRWAEHALSRSVQQASLTLRIVDEEEGRQLNERYRGREGATNVLSFSFDAPEGVDVNLLGDVVICAPVVMREAKEQKKAVEAHFAHMVIHGVLHLLGYDHQTSEEALDMEAV